MKKPNRETNKQFGAGLDENGKKPVLGDFDQKKRSRMARVASEQTPPLSLPSGKTDKQVSAKHDQKPNETRPLIG